MGLGSIVGAVVGGAMVAYVSGGGLKLVLGVVLIASAVRIFRHATRPDAATGAPRLPHAGESRRGS
jgi:uncharacterized membrane protein YfcA